MVYLVAPLTSSRNYMAVGGYKMSKRLCVACKQKVNKNRIITRLDMGKVCFDCFDKVRDKFYETFHIGLISRSAKVFIITPENADKFIKKFTALKVSCFNIIEYMT